MEISQIIPHIEALIFASDKPLTSPEVTELVNNALGFIEDRASQEQVTAAIDGIQEKYAAEFYAFELKQSGGGWQFLTKPAYHKTVALINGDKFIKRLSTASLETLAIIAYKQPITKSEIESIRGVNCDYAVQKLLEKDLVIISGRNEDAVGKPLIYGTSKSFMDYFGINSADELPKISEVLMDEYLKASNVTDMIAENDEVNRLAAEEGEIIVPETAEDADSNEEELTIAAVAIGEEENIEENNEAENNEAITDLDEENNSDHSVAEELEMEDAVEDLQDDMDETIEEEKKDEEEQG
ncbi:MAG: scpB [Ferruginibacter sp.]|nr:scpB [Ferruginibacter sp.]